MSETIADAVVDEWPPRAWIKANGAALLCNLLAGDVQNMFGLELLETKL